MECKLFNGSIIKDGKIHLSSTILECKSIKDDIAEANISEFK